MKNISNETENAFMGWLASSYSGSFGSLIDNHYYTIIRVCKDETFDYLYIQQQWSSTGIERKGNFAYAGIYCKQDGLLYDVQNNLRKFTDDEARNSEALQETLKQAVCQAVEKRIGNDRRNLQISELSAPQEIARFARFQEYRASEQARKVYLSTQSNEENSFYCSYVPNNWTEDSLLRYILDPAQYAATEVEKYINSHQEEMLMDFLCMDAIAVEYTAILETPLAPVHRVKRIMAAVRDSQAKTLTVTICKDGREFTFKTDAQELRRDCTCSYSTWNIAAPDRREFEQLFGHAARYSPEEILCITYARSVLYQA